MSWYFTRAEVVQIFIKICEDMVARAFKQQETSDKGEEERKKGLVTLNRML